MNVAALRLAVVLLLLSAALMLLGVCVGSAGFEDLLRPLLHPQTDPDQSALAAQIVLDIRLPRTIGAWTAGALLGLAGAVAQGLFRNPLADPYLLGSASGAALAVALALLAMGGASGMLGGSMMSAGATFSVYSGSLLVRLGLTGAAFMGAVLAVLLTLVLSRGVHHTLRLLLAGVVVGVVLGAATQLVLLFSPESLQAMQSFMLGSTAFAGWAACGLMVGVWLLGVAIASGPAGRFHPHGADRRARHCHGNCGCANRLDCLCRPGRTAFGALGLEHGLPLVDCAGQFDGRGLTHGR